jgi:hypothetical protein
LAATNDDQVSIRLVSVKWHKLGKPFIDYALEKTLNKRTVDVGM